MTQARPTQLVATDLDNTIIYPPGPGTTGTGPRQPTVIVEGNSRQPVTAMTPAAAATWSRLSSTGALVPVTSRTAKQYAALNLPGRAPQLAIVSNGADILVEGQPDRAWRAAITRRMTACSARFGPVVRKLQAKARTLDFIFDVFLAEDLYAIMGVHPEAMPPQFLPELQAWLTTRGWRTVAHGRRIYVLPQVLEKQAAITHLAESLGVSHVVAGGDSWLDIDMLSAATAAVRPAHGALHEAGWQAPRCAVTRSTGAEAGQEILDWYLQRLDPGASAPAQRTQG